MHHKVAHAQIRVTFQTAAIGLALFLPLFPESGLEQLGIRKQGEAAVGILKSAAERAHGYGALSGCGSVVKTAQYAGAYAPVGEEAAQ